MNMMMNRSVERTDTATSDFVQQLVGPYSELAQQAAKDRYSFQFLGLSENVAERDPGNVLISSITATLRELSSGTRTVPFAWIMWPQRNDSRPAGLVPIAEDTVGGQQPCRFCDDPLTV